MAPFLSRDELKALTGSPQKSQQIKWLRKEGVAFRVTLTGHPAVLWSAVDNTRRNDPAPVAVWNPRVLENA